MKKYLVSLAFLFSASLFAAPHHHGGGCVRDLQSIGVGYGDAVRECNNSPAPRQLGYCSVALAQRGVRGDHAVKECRAQGAGAAHFAHCVIDLVNRGVRTDKAVQSCR